MPGRLRIGACLHGACRVRASIPGAGGSPIAAPTRPSAPNNAPRSRRPPSFPIGGPGFPQWHHYFLSAEAWAGSGAPAGQGGAGSAPRCSGGGEVTPGQRTGGKPLRIAVLHSQDQVDRVLGHGTSGHRVSPAPAGHRVRDGADGTYDRILMMRLVLNGAAVALLGTMIGHG